MNDLVGKDEREKEIWIKKKYAMLKSIISRLEMEKMVHLRLANLKEDNEKVEEKKLVEPIS